MSGWGEGLGEVLAGSVDAGFDGFFGDAEDLGGFVLGMLFEDVEEKGGFEFGGQAMDVLEDFAGPFFLFQLKVCTEPGHTEAGMVGTLIVSEEE